jgi:hypothetical protein
MFNGIIPVDSGSAFADVKADTARLRAFTGSGGPAASAMSAFTDTLTITGPLTFHVYVSSAEFLEGNGEAVTNFDIGLETDSPDTPFERMLRFEKGRTSTGPYWSYLNFANLQGDSGTLAPFPFVTTVTLAGWNGPLRLRVELSTSADCFSEGCFASADAWHTAYLGITGNYVSANGYSYPGFQASDVPEPGSAGLAVAALVLIAVKYCGRSRQRGAKQRSVRC